jgi:hypothetical protein
VKSGIMFGGNSMYDDSTSVYGVLQIGGPTWANIQGLVNGHTGHSDWNMGAALPHSGIISTGKVTIAQLANPSAPTVTAYGGTGTNYTYGLVCTDEQGASTLPGTFSSAVSGPATLGAILTVAVANGGSGYTLGDKPMLVDQVSQQAGDGTAQVQVTSVGSGGVVTGLSVYVAGSKYLTIGAPGFGITNVFSTSGGTGNGLAVAATSSYMKVIYPTEDGCAWTTLKNNTSTKLNNFNSGSGSTNTSQNIIDFGSTSAYSAPTRNSTADASFGGKLITANNTLDDGLANGSISGNLSVTGTVSSSKSAALAVRSCSISLGDGMNAIPVGSYPINFQCKNDTGATITVTGISCATDNAGSTTCDVATNAPSDLLTGAITSNTGTWVAGTQSSTTTITNGQWLKATFVSDGVSTIISLDVAGTL